MMADFENESYYDLSAFSAELPSACNCLLELLVIVIYLLDYSKYTYKTYQDKELFKFSGERLHCFVFYF